MARVWLPGSICDAYLPGVDELEIEAGSVLQLVRALDVMKPGFAAFIEGKLAVAVDGEVSPDWTRRLTPQSEVVLIPRIGGG